MSHVTVSVGLVGAGKRCHMLRFLRFGRILCRHGLHTLSAMSGFHYISMLTFKSTTMVPWLHGIMAPW